MSSKLKISLKKRVSSKAASDSNKKAPQLRLASTEQGHQENKKRKETNQFFYKVSNHHELYKIGSSFFKDFKNGVRSFAITSTGYFQSQQSTILGIASFFDHQSHFKIGIISDNLFLGTFSEVIKGSTKESLSLTAGTGITTYNFHDHFNFVHLSEVLGLANQESLGIYEEILDELTEHFDLILWDVPELEKIQNDPEAYFPMIMNFESLSIIVSKSKSSKEDIENIRDFFMEYGISLKGLLLDSSTTEQPHKKATGFLQRLLGREK